MAPKKQTETEPARPSVEAILTDIHNTLTEGFTALLSKLDDMHEMLAVSLDARSIKIEVAPEPPPKKRPETEMHIDGKGKREVHREPEPLKVEDEREITIEALRAKISEFAEAFGMNTALAVNEEVGGSRKVSNIPAEKYAAVYKEMADRLDLRAEVAAANAKEAAKQATIEDVRAAAQPFVDKYGDPAFRELLGRFGGKKISAIEPSKYAALIEALANA